MEKHDPRVEFPPKDEKWGNLSISVLFKICEYAHIGYVYLPDGTWTDENSQDEWPNEEVTAWWYLPD